MKILFNSPVSNCVQDEYDNLNINWKDFREDFKVSLRSSRTGEESNESNIDAHGIISTCINLSDLKGNAILYFAGYCAFKTITCKDCSQKLLKPEEEGTITMTEQFLYEKNFKKDISKYGALKVPTPLYEDIARIITQIFEFHYKAECHLSNFCEKITDYCMSQIKLTFPSFLNVENEECIGHIKYLISFFVLVLTRRNCKWSVLNREFEKPQKRLKKADSKMSKSSKKLKILKIIKNKEF